MILKPFLPFYIFIKVIKTQSWHMRSLFSDTYSGLFSPMVDKSNSNGSDKGTAMFNTFLVITLRQFHTRTLQKMSVTKYSHILVGPTVLEKCWIVSQLGRNLFYAFYEKKYDKFSIDCVMLWWDNKLHTALC